MNLILCIFALFFSHISFTNDLIEDEIIINKTIFLDKLLVKKKYLVPSNQSRMHWYSEKNRLVQVNKKLEILSELGISSKSQNEEKALRNFSLKLQPQV